MFDRWKAASAAALVLALSPAAHASTGAQPVSFGDTISSPGVYYLNGHQYGSGTGIRITSDFVELRLGPYTLHGDGSSSGIQAEFCQGLKITGGRIENFGDGIRLFECSRAVLEGVYVGGSAESGVEMSYCEYVGFWRVRSEYNGVDGFSLFDCDWNAFYEVSAYHNGGDGFDLSGANVEQAGGSSSDFNLIQECTAAYNYDDGIELEFASWNRVVGNRCSGNHDVGIVLKSEDVQPTLVGDFSSNYNVVRYNECARNYNGIVVEEGCHGNFLSANQALWSGNQADLVEHNYDCSNHWTINLFFYAGGAGAGCIQ